MLQIGKLVTCDRCDTQIFLKRVEANSRDGGYTVVEKYEEPDEWKGWEYKQDIGHLCPECAKAYSTTIKNFMYRY